MGEDEWWWWVLIQMDVRCECLWYAAAGGCLIKGHSFTHSVNDDTAILY